MVWTQNSFNISLLIYFDMLCMEQISKIAFQKFVSRIQKILIVWTPVCYNYDSWSWCLLIINHAFNCWFVALMLVTFNLSAMLYYLHQEKYFSLRICKYYSIWFNAKNALILHIMLPYMLCNSIYHAPIPPYLLDLMHLFNLVQRTIICHT